MAERKLEQDLCQIHCQHAKQEQLELQAERQTKVLLGRGMFPKHSRKESAGLLNKTTSCV